MSMTTITPEHAEAIALQALTFIGGEHRALAGLLAQSGMGPDDVRQGLQDPMFLAGVLDYLLADEPLLLAFCQSTDLPPELPAQARRALPGGER